MYFRGTREREGEHPRVKSWEIVGNFANSDGVRSFLNGDRSTFCIFCLFHIAQFAVSNITVISHDYDMVISPL